VSDLGGSQYGGNVAVKKPDKSGRNPTVRREKEDLEKSNQQKPVIFEANDQPS